MRFKTNLDIDFLLNKMVGQNHFDNCYLLTIQIQLSNWYFIVNITTTLSPPQKRSLSQGLLYQPNITVKPKSKSKHLIPTIKTLYPSTKSKIIKIILIII